MQQLNKQGVRDLNGPKMDGKNYNGRREGHRHNPGTPMISDLEDRSIVDQYTGCEIIEKVRVYRCAFCLVELDAVVD